jgi:hypothetical protein
LAEGRGGAARGYSWEPFKPGNQVAAVHGAYSPRRIGELAESIAAAVTDRPSCPAYLKNPEWEPRILAYARAEAIVQLMWAYIADLDMDTALADRTVSEEDEEHGEGGRVRRRSTTQRVESVLTQVHRHETRAMNLARSLGLDPLSRSRLPKRFGEKSIDIALLAAVRADGDEAV